MPPFQPGALVLFARDVPSKWSDFVNTGDHVGAGALGLVLKTSTTMISDKRVTVYEVFVSGRMTKCWEDELIQAPTRMLE